ncbi:type II secretion system F family protein [Nocardioides mesophilus]|uniref:Type II secretion system F family protein n=1 Tax=Nocardioides mesophilus TaxID=433659 RepID=A0A7G9RGE5_9ACTN|nr:type II secretion system F family protein [Nocardioides mesophilus]QNN54670.1 type II secretion system F family protein [Nocardioides mesophilus]
MSAAAWCAGLLTALAVLGALRPPRRLPGRGAPVPAAGGGPGGPPADLPSGTDGTAWMRAAVGLSGALVAGLFVGGGLALPAALVAGVGCWVAVGRMEPPARRRHRERLEADLPHAVDLLAACLVGGQSPGMAVGHVAAALDGPVAGELAVVAARLRLGVDPVTVWRDVAWHPQLGPLGRSVARALDSGASVAEAMGRLADDLRRDARARVEGRARAVGVKAALPLGVCLLPAFVLTGVVPLVAGSVSGLLHP